MDLSHKIIDKMPLVDLWRENTFLEAKRVKYLNQKAVSEILKNGPIRFVIANVGDKLIWIDLDECFKIYKTEIKEFIISDIDKIYLRTLKDEWGYIASLWADPSENSSLSWKKFTEKPGSCAQLYILLRARATVKILVLITTLYLAPG